MKKILVVDDDADILEAIKIILETEGFDSEVTTKAEEIYKRIESYGPDLIILDVLLSGNDERVICKLLKENNNTKKIPIVMISAHPSAKESVKLSGADSFVPKPFSIDQLVNEIKTYLVR